MKLLTGACQAERPNLGVILIPLDLMDEAVARYEAMAATRGALEKRLDNDSCRAASEARRGFWLWIYEQIPAARGWTLTLDTGHALQWRLIKTDGRLPPTVGMMIDDREIVELWKLDDEQEAEFLELNRRLDGSFTPGECDTFYRWKLLQKFFPSVVGHDSEDLRIVDMSECGEAGVWLARVQDV